MKRTMTMIVALLMSGTAAIAAQGSGSQGQDEQPTCGQPNQPACEPGQTPADKQDDKKKGKGKKPDTQSDQPAGAQGQPPADQGTPPAGGPRGRGQQGGQDQPAAGDQKGPQGSQGPKGPQGPQTPQTQPSTDPATPPAGGPRDRGNQGGQQGPQGPQGPQTQPPTTDQATPPAGGPRDDRRGGQQGGQQGQNPGAGGGQQGQGDRDRDGRDRNWQPGQQGPGGPQTGPQGRFDGPPGGARWSRGQTVPQEYRRDQFYIQDWQRNNLSPPPRGYRWMCYERGNCFLVNSNTGYVSRSFRRDDRDNYWRRRYARSYTYNDDLYYRDCRGRSDPAGILVGGLIGGLVGRSLGDERAGPTFAGIIIGSTLGAAFTRDLDCENRSYAYHSYYDAFNGGRVGRVYAWRNPRNNYRGAFVVRAYFYDEDGFRCARYRHTIWTPRRRQMDGYACRQPDGAWLFLR